MKILQCLMGFTSTELGTPDITSWCIPQHKGRNQ